MIPGYPFSTLSFLLPVLIVIALQVARDWKMAAMGLAIIAVGLPASLLVVPAHRPGVAAGHPGFEPDLDVHRQPLNQK
jgi:hypothetical protein